MMCIHKWIDKHCRKRKPKPATDFPDIQPMKSVDILTMTIVGGWEKELDISVEWKDEYIPQIAMMVINIMNDCPQFADELLRRIHYDNI